MAVRQVDANIALNVAIISKNIGAIDNQAIITKVSENGYLKFTSRKTLGRIFNVDAINQTVTEMVSGVYVTTIDSTIWQRALFGDKSGNYE